MTAMWIGLAVIVVAFLTWRLRRAAKVLDRIVSEELYSPDPEVREAESRNP